MIGDTLDRYAIYPCACHENLPQLRTDIKGIIAKLTTLKCDFTALGSLGDQFPTTIEQADKLIAELSSYGAALQENGIAFGYHNHHTEFTRLGQTTFLDRLYQKSDPNHIKAELDVHWVQRGGGNPVSWIDRMAGRMPVCHFKDYTIVDDEPRFCEIGEGNLEWPSIISACRCAGVRWYVIEQDDPTPGRDIFTSTEISFRALSSLIDER